MKLKYFILIALVSTLAFSSCKKDGFGPLTDSVAEVPVLVNNVYDYRPGPTVKASKAENQIKIVLEIPASTGRKIKEVSRIAAQATGNFTAIYSGTTVGPGTPTQLWSITPVTVNANTYTFTTTFDEYRTKTGATTINSNALLARDFYFKIKLDNDQEIYPMSVRVWVVD